MTEEQVEAVVTFDSRVRVIAAAGSGKTSTMIARAAYAIEKNIAAPGEILLLAFNKKARRNSRNGRATVSATAPWA